jgi:hypothetical protein
VPSWVTIRQSRTGDITAARRYWDFIFAGGMRRLEQQLHHYGSSLNAIPLLTQYREHPDDFYLLRVGYGRNHGRLPIFDEEGFAAAAFHTFRTCCVRILSAATSVRTSLVMPGTRLATSSSILSSAGCPSAAISAGRAIEFCPHSSLHFTARPLADA